ncbi:RICIN domain-containing protein [Streptomyces sp. FH025]|uniref:RICIN domain-containing protein n=1 Tax=Streptomyces sp. FH025 TaxID=2815937 RepID=UPI001A9E6B0F|nr:ricin-type beta-trefoil lectin domain protein [Streptomyces sp. FH025]MBO1416275.1 ricin-type beta-trefoil lectin domain protein [Streptomyces sp. FH025]
MYSIKKAAAATVTVLAVTGAVTAAAPASAGQVRQAGGNVRFFNEATNGSLDANSAGSVAITWEPNGTAFQDWILRPLGPTFRIESVAKPGNCLQLPPFVGDPIQVAPCNTNTASQRWRLDQVGDKFVIADAVDEFFVIEATSTTNPVVKAFRDRGPNQLWDVTPS